MSSLTRRLKDLYLARHHHWVRRGSDHPLQHARRMLAAAAAVRGTRGLLCDVGAGFETSLLADVWGGRRLAVDLVPGRHLDVVADGASLPFRAGSMDAVLLMEVMEHVPAPLSLVCEAARVLRPGGFLCITAPQYCIVHNHPADYYRYTGQGLTHLCGEAGLRVVDVRPTGGPLLVLFHMIEWNLPQRVRIGFVALAYRLVDWLDGVVTAHGRRAGSQDALGWAVLAEKA